MTRWGTWAAGILVAVCMALLLADYVTAPREVFAPKLATEQKRITEVRLARKVRDQWLAWTLIAAAVTFLTCAKTLVPTRRADLLVRAGPPGPAKANRRYAPAPPPLDLSFLDTTIALHGRAKESAILLLQAIQSHYRYLPDEALRRLCELTDITPAQIAGTSSFYAQFRRSPVGQHVVRVCHGTACHVSGARQITEELRRYLAIPEDADTDPSRTFTLDQVACLGCCSLAPVLMVDGHTAGRLTPATARNALQPFEQQETA